MQSLNNSTIMFLYKIGKLSNKCDHSSAIKAKSIAGIKYNHSIKRNYESSHKRFFYECHYDGHFHYGSINHIFHHYSKKDNWMKNIAYVFLIYRFICACIYGWLIIKLKYKLKIIIHAIEIWFKNMSFTYHSKS